MRCKAKGNKHLKSTCLLFRREPPLSADSSTKQELTDVVRLKILEVRREENDCSEPYSSVTHFPLCLRPSKEALLTSAVSSAAEALYCKLLLLVPKESRRTHVAHRHNYFDEPLETLSLCTVCDEKPVYNTKLLPSHSKDAFGTVGISRICIRNMPGASWQINFATRRQTTEGGSRHEQMT